jgi:ketosteroid isomerase-like protein
MRNMKKLFFLISLLVLILGSCNYRNDESNIENWKTEIIETEKAFADMAKKEGIPKAFLAYAAEDAVLMRNNILIKGKDAIKNSLGNQDPGSGNNELTWEPDFVDVSRSGDLGYTYGSYTYSFTDTSGAVKLDSGIFHTVWKRQANGEWRFVWD